MPQLVRISPIVVRRSNLEQSNKKQSLLQNSYYSKNCGSCAAERCKANFR